MMCSQTRYCLKIVITWSQYFTIPFQFEGRYIPFSEKIYKNGGKYVTIRSKFNIFSAILIYFSENWKGITIIIFKQYRVWLHAIINWKGIEKELKRNWKGVFYLLIFSQFMWQNTREILVNKKHLFNSFNILYNLLWCVVKHDIVWKL